MKIISFIDNFISTVGIGAALCKALVESGMIVCGMSKRKDKMEVKMKHFFLFSNQPCQVQTFTLISQFARHSRKRATLSAWSVTFVMRIKLQLLSNGLKMFVVALIFWLTMQVSLQKDFFLILKIPSSCTARWRQISSDCAWSREKLRGSWRSEMKKKEPSVTLSTSIQSLDTKFMLACLELSHLTECTQHPSENQNRNFFLLLRLTIWNFPDSQSRRSPNAFVKSCCI